MRVSQKLWVAVRSSLPTIQAHIQRLRQLIYVTWQGRWVVWLRRVTPPSSLTTYRRIIRNLQDNSESPLKRWTKGMDLLDKPLSFCPFCRCLSFLSLSHVPTPLLVFLNWLLPSCQTVFCESVQLHPRFVLCI